MGTECWDSLIKEQEEKSKKCEEDNWDKLQYSNPYERQIGRLLALKELDSLDVDWEYGAPGLVVITNDKGKRHTYSLLKGRWTVDNKTWYYSKSIKHFVENYLNREFDNGH